MICIDYYQVLGLQKTCSKFDIRKAFHKIVNDFGMADKLNNDDTARRLIAFEAYDVLGNPFWREMYDKYGDKSIKTGVFVYNAIKKKKVWKRYSYHGDIFVTYESVYGSKNPYAHIMGELSFNGTLNDLKKPDAKKIQIYLSLHEIFFGALKKIDVPYTCGVPNIVNVKIPKGLPVNSEIAHNATYGKPIIFITNDLPHERFMRVGADLITTYTVTIKEMLCGARFVVKTLDGKQLRVNITQVITPTYQKTIRGEGMPVFNGENNIKKIHKRGDIILKFIVKMPRYFTLSNADEIREALLEPNLITD